MRDGNFRSVSLCAQRVILLMLFSGLLNSCLAQSQPPSVLERIPTTNSTIETETQMNVQTMDQERPGNISGTIEDQSGAVRGGANVRLTREGESEHQEVLSGTNGEFSFDDVPPGRFHLEISSAGFITQKISGVLQPGQFCILPRILLAVSGGETEVRVALPPVEVAEEQIKEQEKQRVFGIIPNFYVTYDPDPVPLNSKQKFKLAWKSSIDPITFVAAGVVAGFQQASDDYSGYGQGMQGYAKRFGSSYADVFAGTFIGSAIFPAVFKQDPRYFYKGTGSIRSRIGYALASSVICKGDNKRWQPNYSSMVGSFATGAASYLYNPASNRSAGLLLQTSLLRIAESSFVGVFQEFLVRKLTPHVGKHDRGQP